MARRHRVDERIVTGIAVAAGVAAALGGAEPTGSPAIDAILTTLAVAFVTWAAATAPWWALTVTAAVATAISGSWPLLLAGALSLVVALWIGTERRDLAPARAVAAGVALNVIVRADFDPFLGFGALVGLACAVLLVTLGVRRRSRRARRWTVIGAGIVGAVAVIAIVGAAVGAASAQSDLRQGNVLARDAVEQLSNGDYGEAADNFEAAASRFAAADEALGKPWVQLASVVPIIAQNRDAAAELAAGASAASSAIDQAVGVVDLDQLRISGGLFDVDAIRLLETPFAGVDAAVESLANTVDDVRSPWLVGPLATRLDALDEDITDYQPRLRDAITAIGRVPGLLGADGPRTYFVAFTTPAETRGLGGFMGNWVELTIDHGAIEVSDSGRTGDLNRGGTSARTVSGPQDWLETWGQYGFDNGPGGTTDAVPWSNITISPQFSSTGQVIAELYPQSGGQPLDGVFALDPYAVQALLGFTGPVQVAGVDKAINSGNVIDFLLVEQYELENDDRLDVLEEVSQATIRLLLAGALPGPFEVADALGPMVDQGRIVGWAADAAEQQYFADLGLSGDLPALDGGDGVAVVLNNAGANKLDVYLERTLTYQATTNPSTGVVESTATVELTNHAPSEGLPGGVIGNYTGDAQGTNRVLVSLYSALPVRSASVRTPDGTDEAFTVEPSKEAGWLVGSTFFAIPPGSSITITYELAGNLATVTPYRLAVRPQPIVIDETLDVSVVDDSGDEVLGWSGPSLEATVLQD